MTATAQSHGGQPLRVLLVCDVWPSEQIPGAGAFVRAGGIALARAGHPTYALVPRRLFPPRRLFAAARHPSHIKSVAEAWLREDCFGSLLEPPPVTVVPYTSPPRQIAHDRWGDWAIKLAGRRFLKAANEVRPDVVHAHWATPSGRIAVWLGERLGIPSVVTSQGYDLDYSAIFRPRGARSVGKILSEASAVIVDAGPMVPVASGLIGRARTIHVLWQGGDLLPAPAHYEGPPRVISVGGISAIKGHDCAAHALSICRKRGARFTWTVVGRGVPAYEGRLRSLVESLGLADVTTWRRDLTNEQVLQEMSSADVFLLLSTREPYGVVYAEAMGAGLAVVGSSAAGAMADFAEANGPVAAVPPGDPKAAADALWPLLIQPHVLAERKAQCRQFAAARLGWDRYAEHLVQIYRSLTRG